MNTQRTILSILGLSLCFISLPNLAYAYTLTCSNGVPAGGTIFFGVANCDVFTVAQPFSALNCYFKQILNEVVARMYCGIQFEFGFTLQIIILLSVIMYGLMFSLGLAALTASELTTRLIKIALIWAFATNATWGVGLAMYFFFGGIDTMVTWVLGVFFPNMGNTGFIAYIDFLLYNQLTQGLTANGLAMFGFFATLAYLMFPVFLLFVVYMMTIMAALTRTVVSYLIGISGIAFLIALGPIFISMAMFKPTYTFFDSWLKYLISFALQIVLIFAAVALWLFVMSLTGTFFLDLISMIVPYENVSHTLASANIVQDTKGICYSGYGSTVLEDGSKQLICRSDGNSAYCNYSQWLDSSNDKDSKCFESQIQPPSAYSANSQFMSWVTTNLLGLGALVYAFDALLKIMPHVARQLAGPAFAPQLGGGTGFGAVQMPGFSALGQLKQGLMFQAKSGAFSWFAQQRNNIGANIAGTPAAGGGGKPSKAQDAKGKAGMLAGGNKKKP